MLPIVSWADLVPPDTRVHTLEAGRHVAGNVSDFELEVINRLVAFHRPEAVFEIGTFDGRTTLNMAAHASQSAHVYTLDLPPGSIDDTTLHIESGDRTFIDKAQSGARFAGTDLAARITQLYGDSGRFDFGPFRGKMDFIFVDGSHSYEYVLSDSHIAMELARPDAVILWHDYSSHGPAAWPGLTRALDELHAGNPSFKSLRHLAGTAIAILELPGPKNSERKARRLPPPNAVWGDSSQPEYLLAEISISPSSFLAGEGASLQMEVTARNTGRTIWLPEGAPVGPVRLGSRLLNAAGDWLDISFSRNPLPGPDPVPPGGSVSFNAAVRCPPKGKYVLEFDLVAEGVAWFSRNGSATTAVSVDIT